MNSLPTERINRGFRPNLRKKLPREFIEYADFYQICDTGLPAPTFNNESKAAVWFAGQPTRSGELPVIAVVSTSGADFIDFTMPWYVGAIEKRVIEDRQFVDSSIAPYEATLLSAAEHGPNPLKEAFSLLVKLFPIE